MQTNTKQEHISISYTIYDSSAALNSADAALLAAARAACAKAYAPYSQFHVGAAALLTNGETVSGANQENASFPVGICAERVLLSAVSAVYPGQTVQAMAISYENQKHSNNNIPASPCGMCRQALAEWEQQQQAPLRLILAGQTGTVFVIESASSLLPLAFKPEMLK